LPRVSLRQWLDTIEPEPEDALDPTNVFVQTDALAAERVEQNDAKWTPPETSTAGLARLVRARQARKMSQ
jgi:hypothetical protein